VLIDDEHKISITATLMISISFTSERCQFDSRVIPVRCPAFLPSRQLQYASQKFLLYYRYAYDTLRRWRYHYASLMAVSPRADESRCRLVDSSSFARHTATARSTTELKCTHAPKFHRASRRVVNFPFYRVADFSDFIIFLLFD